MYGYFTHGTDPPSPPLLIWFLLPSRSSSSAAFPNPFRCRFLGHKLSLASGTTQQSDYWQSTVSPFASAYRVTSSGTTGDPASPPEVTRHSSVPCRPQSPCFWWVNEKRLRLPIAGSTLPHLRPTGSSSGWSPSITARHFSSCPSDSASRRTPCPPGTAERRLQARLGCVRLSSSCPFRLLHTFHSSGRRGVTPAFGYGAPHSNAGGT
jgi:hypothetical protein